MNGLRNHLAAAAVLGLLVGLAACGGDDDSDKTAFCDRIEEIQARSSEELGTSDNVEGIEQAKQELERIQGQLAELEDVAPEDIAGDLEQVSTFFEDLVTALQKAKTPQEYLSTTVEFQRQGQELGDAARNLNEYAQTECDLDLGVEPATP